MIEEPHTPFMSWRHWGVAGFLLFAVGIAVGISAGWVVGEQGGWIAGILAGALVALIRISWPLRHKGWFWAAVAVFVAADVLAVGDVDWSFTDKWNGHSMSGLAMLDLSAMMSVIYGLYRLHYGAPAKVIEDVPDEPNYGDRDFDL
jgi:hypothetical protein